MTEREAFQQQVREQVQAAEHMVQDSFHLWSTLALSTTEMSFNLAEQSLRSSQEILSIYHRMYSDGVKTWQSYLSTFGETVQRATRAASNGTPRR
ncbi:MAG TPA: hypothetical protein VFZ66_24225 [Herpetosiphonaceae bacterium]